jgi:hypothetical protein
MEGRAPSPVLQRPNPTQLECCVNDKPFRYVGNPDFHDGFIRVVSRTVNKVLVSVEGCTGKYYAVTFEGVSSVESHSPQDMMLYALSEQDTNVESLHHYDFINGYSDEPQKEESKSYLRIVANGFAVIASE